MPAGTHSKGSQPDQMVHRRKTSSQQSHRRQLVCDALWCDKICLNAIDALRHALHEGAHQMIHADTTDSF